jgi:hypothetical protein
MRSPTAMHALESTAARACTAPRGSQVIDKDGCPTKHMDELITRARSPLPHRNALEPWCPCWPCFIPNYERLVDMTYVNTRNLVAMPAKHVSPEQIVRR